MKKNPWNSELVIGLLIIAVGVLFVMDNLDIVYAWDILWYWPAVTIVIGVMKLATPRASRFWSWAFILVGGVLLLKRLDIIDFEVQLFLFPFILIGVGAAVLWNSLTRQSTKTVVFRDDKSPSDETRLGLTAVMGGIEKKVTSPDFKGGKVTTIMGGAELDFRNAVIQEEEAVLDVMVLMGGIEMQVPENWRVITKSVPIMGAISDGTQPTESGKLKRFIIQGNILMGAVEIKN